MERSIQKKVQVEGSWVTVDIYGDPDGHAIVIIPGVMADAVAWAPVAQSLNSWRTVAVVNRRGRQPSGPLSNNYSLQTEVEDAAKVLSSFAEVRTLFGWSYGGLIALNLANERPIPHVIAYEPVMRPFGYDALPLLRQADHDANFDAVLEIALRHVTGAGDDMINSLRADAVVWSELCRLSKPVYGETLAINESSEDAALATEAARVDLIIGELSRGRAPYGTSFNDIAQRVRGASVHELSQQGHLAHVEAPAPLGALINTLARHPKT